MLRFTISSDREMMTESTQPMSLTPVIPFDSCCLKLGDAVLLRLDLKSVGIPVVCAIDCGLPTAKPIHQWFEGSLITIPAFPVNEAP